MAWAATVTAVPTVLPIVEFDEGERDHLPAR